MKRKKRTVFLLLLLSALFPALQGFSEETPEEPQEVQAEGDFQFVKIEEDAVEMTGYTGSETEVRIPVTLGGLSVRGIGKSAFAGTGILSVSVPGGAAYIDERAFADCPSLKSISLPDSIEAMALSAFLGTPLDSKKFLPDNSPKNELELYEEWARCLEYKEMEVSSPDGKPANMIEKEGTVYGEKVTVRILPQKEGAFDENAEIDGLIFAYGSIEGSHQLEIYSYQDRPFWYWNTQKTGVNFSGEIQTWSKNGQWPAARGNQFFNELRAIGFFKWGRRYDPGIVCGLGWNVFVKFSNSDKYFASGASNYFPPNFDEFVKILHRYGFEDVPFFDEGDDSGNGQDE